MLLKVRKVTNVQTVRDCALHQWIVRQCLKSRLLVFDLKVALCTRVLRTSDELKISIEAARLSCPETKDETHLLPLPLFVTIAEFDPADQRVRSGMSVRTKMLCDGKTRRNLVDASEVFTKSFPQSMPSLIDVNGGASTAGDAVNETR